MEDKEQEKYMRHLWKMWKIAFASCIIIGVSGSGLFIYAYTQPYDIGLFLIPMLMIVFSFPAAMFLLLLGSGADFP
jgi:hypothetical protein